MTTKERLHRLVDGLADEQVARALVLLESVTGPPGLSAGAAQFHARSA